jgi:hypothetical protein
VRNTKINLVELKSYTNLAVLNQTAMTQTAVVTKANLEMFKANAIQQLWSARELRSTENLLFVINDITSMYDYESEELETELFAILKNQILVV